MAKRQVKAKQLFDCDYYLVEFTDDNKLLVTTGDKIDAEDPSSLITQTMIMVEWPEDKKLYPAKILALGDKDIMLKKKLEVKERKMKSGEKDPGKNTQQSDEGGAKKEKVAKNIGKKGEKDPGKNTQQNDEGGAKKEKVTKSIGNKEKQNLKLTKEHQINYMKELARGMSFAIDKAASLTANKPDIDSNSDDVETNSDDVETDNSKNLSYEAKASTARKENEYMLEKLFGGTLNFGSPSLVKTKRQKRKYEEDEDFDMSEEEEEDEKEEEGEEEEEEEEEEEKEEDKLKNDIHVEEESHMQQTNNKEQCTAENCPYKLKYEALKMKLERVQTSSASAITPAGVYAPEYGKKNKMIEIVPGSNVFITKCQLQSVLTGVDTRQKIATRLLRCFLNAEELRQLQSYTNVEAQIREAIEGCAMGIKCEEVKDLPVLKKTIIKKALANHVIELSRKKRTRKTRK